MTAYTKFDQFTEDLIRGVHKFQSDTFKIALSAVLPSSSNATLSAITQIAAGGGYSTGGSASVVTESTLAGVAKVVFGNVIFTGSGGGMAGFRYVVIYNDTPTSPADPLIGFADAGSTITLNAGDTFTVAFSPSNGLFTVGP